MNRLDYRSTACRGLILCLISLGPLGCIRILDKGPQIPTVPARGLRQIEPLQLQQIEPNIIILPPEPNVQAVALTLEQCRAIALQNNLELKATLVGPVIAQQRLDQERARFEAVFNANTTLNITDTPSVSYYDEIYGSQAKGLFIDLGLERPLETGGSVALRATDARVRTDAIGTRFNPYYGSDLTFSISQPLLRNAGIPTATYGIHIAALDRQITDARTRLEVIRLLASVDRLYWRVYGASKELEVRRQQLDLARAQLERARRLVEQGQAPQVEIIRAQAGLAQRMEAVIIAQNNLMDRQRELKRILNQPGLDVKDQKAISIVTQPRPVFYELDPERLVDAAFRNRMELLELELQLAQDAITIDYQKNQALPLVLFDYTYNLNGLGESRSESWDLLTDNRFADNRVGLRLQVPIGNQLAKSRLRLAIYQKCQRLATAQSRRSQIEIEVLNAVANVRTNWHRIIASRDNTILQTRLYEAEKRQFDLGLNTSTDVLDAQARLAEAQTAEIAALVDYQIALVDLAYATGTLIGASNIQWEPMSPDLKPSN